MFYRTAAYYRKLDKRFLAIVGAIAMIAVGSISYFITSQATYTHQPDSASKGAIVSEPSNLAEPKKLPANVTDAKKTVANVTEPKKGSPESNSAGPSMESILYIRSIYDHPYLVRGVGGVSFSATPFNFTSDIVVNLPGGAGVTLKQCIHRLPSPADLPPCPQGKTYTTNNTGWATIYPRVGAKYYLLIRETLTGGTYAIAQIHANQTNYATITVPIPGPRHNVGDNSGILSSKGFLSLEALAWPLSHLSMLNGTSASFTFTLAPSKECLQKADVCSDSDFPLRVDISSSSLGIKPLIYSYTASSKLRAVWEKEALLGNDPHYNLTDASITIAPNPVFLGRNGGVNVTVTITAKSTASYGLYHMTVGAMVYSVAGNAGERALYWMMPYDLQLYLTINPYPVIVGENYYFDKQGSSIVVPFIRNSTLFKDSTWFRFNYDGTFYVGSDSGSKQVGWWEIINNELFFTLPNMTFQGRIIENVSNTLGSSLILDDGSVWNVRTGG